MKAHAFTLVQFERMNFGDIQGHEFHGNQWTGGQGGTDKEFSVSTRDLTKIAVLKNPTVAGFNTWKKENGDEYDTYRYIHDAGTGDTFIWNALDEIHVHMQKALIAHGDIISGHRTTQGEGKAEHIRNVARGYHDRINEQSYHKPAARENFGAKFYSDTQARDDHGRWVSEGGGGQPKLPLHGGVARRNAKYRGAGKREALAPEATHGPHGSHGHEHPVLTRPPDDGGGQWQTDPNGDGWVRTNTDGTQQRWRAGERSPSDVTQPTTAPSDNENSGDARGQDGYGRAQGNGESGDDFVPDADAPAMDATWKDGALRDVDIDPDDLGYHNSKSILVLKNPDESQVGGLDAPEIRIGVNASNGDVFAWDGGAAIHQPVMSALGLGNRNQYQPSNGNFDDVFNANTYAADLKRWLNSDGYRGRMSRVLKDRITNKQSNVLESGFKKPAAREEFAAAQFYSPDQARDTDGRWTAGQTGFLKALDAGTSNNPLLRNTRVMGKQEVETGKKHFANIEVYPSSDGRINIASIQSFDAGAKQGTGTMALEMLKELADKHGVPLELYAKHFGDKGLRTSQLISWYKRHGFVPDTRRLMEGQKAGRSYPYLVRMPKGSKAKFYSPDQARDADGKWTGGGGSLTEKAFKEFGTTTNPREAGYIMDDGQMLDFSGKREGGEPGVRATDHREVSRIYPDSENLPGYQAMARFLDETHAIRFHGSDDGTGIATVVSLPSDSALEQLVSVSRNGLTLNVGFTDRRLYERTFNEPEFHEVKRFIESSIDASKFYRHPLFAYNPDEARDDHGRWTTGGEIFVSPNQEENLTFREALAKMSSDEQAKLHKMAAELTIQAAGGGTVEDAIGDWSDGAENSMIVSVNNADATQYVAAKLASQANQKAVIAFVANPDGNDSVWRAEARGKSLDAVRADLDEMGVHFRTLTPGAASTRITVFDQGSALADTMAKVGERYGKAVGQVKGSGEFIGGDTRADGQAAYAPIIRQWEQSHAVDQGHHLRLSRQGNRDHWSTETSIVVFGAATMIIKDAEIFSSGMWPGLGASGITFSDADLDGIVSSFNMLNLAGRVPLKVGHDGADARTNDTAPSLGWVDSVKRVGNKLLADIRLTSDRLAEGIRSGAYKFVSCELLRNVQAHTRQIPWVLDAVALLGATAPAVGTLRDLQASMSFRVQRSPLRGERVAFRRDDAINQHGDSNDMDEQQVQAAIAKAVKDATVKFTADLAAVTTRLNTSMEETVKARAQAHRFSVLAPIEAAIANGTLNAAAKDKFSKQNFIDDDVKVLMATPAMAETFISDVKDMKSFKGPGAPKRTAGASTDDESRLTEMSASQVLSFRTEQRVIKLGQSVADFSALEAASRYILSTDKHLAQQYFADHSAQYEAPSASAAA